MAGERRADLPPPPSQSLTGALHGIETEKGLEIFGNSSVCFSSLGFGFELVCLHKGSSAPPYERPFPFSLLQLYPSDAPRVFVRCPCPLPRDSMHAAGGPLPESTENSKALLIGRSSGRQSHSMVG